MWRKYYTCQDFLLKILCQNVYFSKVTPPKYDAKATKSINKLHCSIYEKHWSSLLYVHTYIHHTNTTTTQGQLVKMTSEEQFLAQRSRSLLPNVRSDVSQQGFKSPSLVVEQFHLFVLQENQSMRLFLFHKVKVIPLNRVTGKKITSLLAEQQMSQLWCVKQMKKQTQNSPHHYNSGHAV